MYIEYIISLFMDVNTSLDHLNKNIEIWSKILPSYLIQI